MPPSVARFARSLGDAGPRCARSRSWAAPAEPASPASPVARSACPLLAALVLAAAGCSSFPEARAPSRAAGGQRLPLRIALAPATVELASDERPKGYDVRDLVDARDLTRELGAWVDAAQVASAVRVVPGEDAAAALDDAWRAGDDLLLEVAARELRTEFLGHNLLWVPNMVNWLWWMIPAWFVATEEYGLSLSLQATVRSVDSGRVLHEVEVDAEVEGTFNELDRGWQLFGAFYPLNDADNWRLVAERLLPGARSLAAERLARALAGALPAVVATPEAARARRKALAVAVGVSHYEDPVQLPPLAFAGDDASSIAAVATACGLPGRHVRCLLNGAATRAGLLDALAWLRARARDGDAVLVYFAGYGTRDRDGRPRLLLHEAAGGEVGLLELGAALGAVAGDKLVVLDCAFDGNGRSVRGPAPPPEDPLGDARELASRAGALVLLAGAGQDTILAPAHRQAGLLTHHLRRGLAGQADRDEDGQVTAEELVAFVREQTQAEAALLGAVQEPRAAGSATAFSLPLAGAP